MVSLWVVEKGYEMESVQAACSVVDLENSSATYWVVKLAFCTVDLMALQSETKMAAMMVTS